MKRWLLVLLLLPVLASAQGWNDRTEPPGFPRAAGLYFSLSDVLVTTIALSDSSISEGNPLAGLFVGGASDSWGVATGALAFKAIFYGYAVTRNSPDECVEPMSWATFGGLTGTSGGLLALAGVAPPWSVLGAVMVGGFGAAYFKRAGWTKAECQWWHNR